jgi:hypothetical protein
MEVLYTQNKVKHSLTFEKETKEAFETVEDSSEYITLLKTKIPKHIAKGELLYLSISIDFSGKTPDNYTAIVKQGGNNTTFTNPLNF